MTSAPDNRPAQGKAQRIGTFARMMRPCWVFDVRSAKWIHLDDDEMQSAILLSEGNYWHPDQPEPPTATPQDSVGAQPTSEKILTNINACLKNKDRLGRLSVVDLFTEVLSSDAGDYDVVIELLNRIWPGWEQQPDGTFSGEPPAHPQGQAQQAPKWMRDYLASWGESVDPLVLMNDLTRWKDPPPYEERWAKRVAAACDIAAYFKKLAFAPAVQPTEAGELSEVAAVIKEQLDKALMWEKHYKSDPEGKLDEAFWQGRARGLAETLDYVTRRAALSAQPDKSAGGADEFREVLAECRTMLWHAIEAKAYENIPLQRAMQDAKKKADELLSK